MKLKHFFLLVLLSFCNYSFSCDCPPIDRETMIEKELKNSDIVFYGEVIKTDSVSGNFTFKIIELFKGKYNSLYIKGKDDNSCSLFPKTKQLWIVYASYKEGEMIEISLCSPSRGFIPTEGSYPPPMPKFYFKNDKSEEIQSIDSRVFDLEIENRNLQDWIYQLEKLRIYKKAQKEISGKEIIMKKLETYSLYIIISLIVNIVLFLSLLFVILKKKNLAK